MDLAMAFLIPLSASVLSSPTTMVGATRGATGGAARGGGEGDLARVAAFAFAVKIGMKQVLLRKGVKQAFGPKDRKDLSAHFKSQNEMISFL